MAGFLFAETENCEIEKRWSVSFPESYYGHHLCLCQELPHLALTCFETSISLQPFISCIICTALVMHHGFLTEYSTCIRLHWLSGTEHRF
jgi:hypothetical protein